MLQRNCNTIKMRAVFLVATVLCAASWFQPSVAQLSALGGLDPPAATTPTPTTTLTTPTTPAPTTSTTPDSSLAGLGGLPDNSLLAQPDSSLGSGLINAPPSTTTPAASTGLYCNMTSTFFPKGYENLAFPPPFTLENQVAAGWDESMGDPFRVAIAGFAPKLYFGVNWVLLTQDTVPDECIPSVQQLMCSAPQKTTAAPPTKAATTPPSAATTAAASLAGRKLNAAAAAGKMVVTKAIIYDPEWQLAGGPSATKGPVTKMEPFIVGEGAKPYLIKVPDYGSLEDGDYCIYVTATARASSGAVSYNGVNYPVPCKPVSQTRKFCFTKVVQRPLSTFSFHSCDANFTAKFTDIKPAAAYALATIDPPKQLFSVIVHLYGNATENNRFDDRSAEVIGDGATFFVDTRNGGDEALVITDPVQNSIEWTTDRLYDGKYFLYVEMLLKSDVPSLCNLSGPVDQNTFTTYQGWIVVNDSTPQARAKRTAIGNEVIVYHEKSTFEPLCPQNPVKLPAVRVFEWSSTGKGTFDCYVDNRLNNNNKKTKKCQSPFSLTLSDNKNHTMLIRYTDICGNVIDKKMIFGAWGCVRDTKGEPPSPPPPPPPSPDAAPSTPLLSFNTNLTASLGSGAAMGANPSAVLLMATAILMCIASLL